MVEVDVEEGTYAGVGLQRRQVADGVVDGHAHGEGDALHGDLAVLALVLEDVGNTGLNGLVTESADVDDLGVRNALQSDTSHGVRARRTDDGLIIANIPEQQRPTRHPGQSWQPLGTW